MPFGPSRKMPNYGPGAVQSQSLAPMGFDETMAMLNASAPKSPIQAPKDRGMFGRFKGFNPLRFDPDKGVGEGNRLYALGAMLAGMGTGDPGLTANLLEPKLQQNRERVQARDEEAKRQQMMQQLGQMPGLTEQQRMAAQYNPEGFMDEYTKGAFAPPPEKPKPLQYDGLFLDPDNPQEIIADHRKDADPLSTMGKLASDLRNGEITQQEYDFELQRLERSGVNLTFNPFGGGAQSLAEIPVGQPVPESLLGGIALPEDTYAVRANNPAGFEFATIPGSATARKAESGEQAKGGRTYTLGSLIGSFSTLAKNKAITARGNTTLDNAAAMYSGTGIGQTQDKLGGGVGNLANAEAREVIGGLSMKALMDMISMSDVSAKAMDSDAEMKAWLSAIKSDNYEAALTKLHVFDLSFGSGQELERAYADGTIDLSTYQYVTNRVNSDPMVKQMLDRADRYAALGSAVGRGNLTGGERQSMQDLAGLVAPDGSAVTEDDIQETMAATGMTREQIINRLRGQ